MQTTSTLPVRAPSWNYRLPLLILLLGFGFTLSAERITRTLVEEVAVTPETEIFSQGPRPVPVNGRGAIDVRNEAFTYVVSGWRPLPRIFVLDRRAEMRSWEQSRVRQEVTITLETETPAQATALLGALRIKLVPSATGRLSIDYDLNVATVNLYNGWFAREENYLVLDDGRRFPVRYFALSTLVYLPTINSLSLDLEHCYLTLEDRAGPTVIIQHHGSLTAGCLGSLRAELQAVTAQLDSARTADLTLTDSALRLGASSTLHLRSALSKIDLGQVENLTVSASVNDRLLVRSLARAELTEILFDTITCRFLSRELSLTARNTELRVDELAPSLERVNVDNRDATIRLGVGRLPAYRLERDSSEKNKYSLPEATGPPSAGGPVLHLRGTHCRYFLTGR